MNATPPRDPRDPDPACEETLDSASSELDFGDEFGEDELGRDGRSASARGGDDDEPRPDELLGGKFAVLDELGRGGMGVVYKVHHRALDRVMAVKRMSGRSPTTAQFLRFRREAQAACDLDHPNILRVHDLDRDTDGTPVIVMEYLEGRDLRALLADEGPLSAARAASLLRGVADALDHAHAIGIVHRDLKPANLFVTRAGVAKLLDFGICHLDSDVGELTRPGQIIGTPHYMAPEQIRGEPASPASDVYSLAVILYEALTGRRPFEGRNLIQLAARQAGDAPPRADATPSGLTRAVSDVLERGMAFQPGDRFPTAGALLDALAAAARGQAPVRPARRGRRAPRIALAVATVVAAGAAVAVIVPWLGGPPPLGRVRLLVAPFAHTAERDVDRDLWPLVDRMIVRALGPDDLALGRLDRVDPAAVERAIEVRQLGPTMDEDDLLELAAALDANVVLHGTLRRERGLLHLDGALRTVASGKETRVSADGPRLMDVAWQLAREVRRALWDGASAEPPPERVAALLVGTAASASALLGPDAPPTSADVGDRYRGLLDSDPKALGAAWLRYLENPRDAGRRADLARLSSAAPDPELAALFRGLGEAPSGADPCAGFDAAAVGARFPLLVGPLGAAVCHAAAGDSDGATRLAIEAFESLPLRRVARPFLTWLLSQTETCEDLLPLRRRMQQLEPEYALGWATLATWLARCGTMAEARRALAAARVLLDESDRRGLFMVGFYGAWVHLADLDPAAAREWLALMERYRDADERWPKYYFVTSQAYFMQGRFREGLDRVREGMAALDDPPGDAWTMLAATEFYVSLAQGDLEGAGRVAAAIDAAFPVGSDAGNRYQAEMFALALLRARGAVDDAALEARMRALGDGAVAALGDLGRSERDAQECLLVTHFSNVAMAERVLRRAAPANRMLGGCRLLQAQSLLARGRATEAADEYRRAIEDIVWARFLYAEFAAPAMLGYARALRDSGQRPQACDLYDRLGRNFARADRLVPEVRDAAQERGVLCGPREAP